MEKSELEATMLRQFARAVREGLLPIAPRDEYLQSQLFFLYSSLRYWSALKADEEGNRRRRQEAADLLGGWIEDLRAAGCDKESEELGRTLADVGADGQVLLNEASVCLGRLEGRLAPERIATLRAALRRMMHRHNDELIEQLLGRGDA